jgi:hypothetical protein
LTKYEGEKGKLCAEQANHGRISREEFIEHSHPARSWLEKIRSHTKELSLMVRKLTALNQKSETNNQQ